MKVLENQVCFVELTTERFETLFKATPLHLIQGTLFVGLGYPVKFMIGHFCFINSDRVTLDLSAV